MLSRGFWEVDARAPENEAKTDIKSPKNAKLGAAAARHGRPCHHARPCVHHTHGRACGARLAVRACTASRAVAALICGLLPGVHGRAPLWHPRARPVFWCFAVLYARDVLEPLIFLDFTFEVLFSIEIRWFLLKWRQTQFRHKMNRRKIIWP